MAAAPVGSSACPVPQRLLCTSGRAQHEPLSTALGSAAVARVWRSICLPCAVSQCACARQDYGSRGSASAPAAAWRAASFAENGGRNAVWGIWAGRPGLSPDCCKHWTFPLIIWPGLCEYSCRVCVCAPLACALAACICSINVLSPISLPPSLSALSCPAIVSRWKHARSTC